MLSNTIPLRRRGRRWLSRALLAGFLVLIAIWGTALAQASTSRHNRTAAVKSHGAAASPQAGCDTATLQANAPSGVTINSATPNNTGTFTPPPGSLTVTGTTSGPITGLPDFCEVDLTQDDSSGNPLHDYLWLPDSWNGRFLGVGGGGFVCGPGYTELAAGIEGGYATASTDCGVNDPTGGFALTSSDQLNHALINDFSYIGMHLMTVTGKAVSTSYYDQTPSYSYFDGCSTGGREGLMEAQRYPADYNGIVSGSPAINWTEFIPAEIWPALVQNEMNDFLAPCKEAAFTEAATVACGGIDGVIQNPDSCAWNPQTLVGTVTPCGTITSTDAAVMEKILQGPVSLTGKKLWYGLEPGASLTGLASTTVNPTTGAIVGSPFPIATDYIADWLLQDPSWDWHTLTYAQFDQLFAQSVSEYETTIATNDADLRPFKEDGGKLVIFHGLADPLIFPQGSIRYYQSVEQAMGGAAATDSFARLYLAPGAQHCIADAGPYPPQFMAQFPLTQTGNPLSSVVDWVEQGHAPNSLLAVKIDATTGVTTESRPLCAYPAEPRYTGGNPNLATSYLCPAPGSGWSQRRRAARG